MTSASVADEDEGRHDDGVSGSVRTTVIALLRALGQAAPAAVLGEANRRLGDDAQPAVLRALSALIAEELVALELAEDDPQRMLVREVRWVGAPDAA